MNRLILIGNGFDIAHGLKTSYHDFVLDYFKQSILKAFENGLKQSTTSRTTDKFYINDDSLLVSIRIYNIGNEKKIIELIEKFEEIEDLINFSNLNKIQFKYHFSILETTVKEFCNQNWINVEELYFEHLIALKSKKNAGAIVDYNKKFEFLKEQLKNYLQKAQFRKPTSTNDNLLTLIHKYNDIFERIDNVETSGIVEKLILNFNYTNTLELYRNTVGLYGVSINYIHGNINQTSNNILFGFGDEHNQDYINLKNEKDKNYFKNIKQLHYFKSPSYSDLKRFLVSSDFEVYILGHSCSLSDRTLLKEIFESDNCKKIKIFYYEKDNNINDYDDKIIDIMRHFASESIMRDKIVNYKLSEKMPQLNN